MNAVALRELQQLVAGRVLTERQAVAPFARDFGGLVHCPPQAVVPVSNEAELCAVLRWLRRAGVPVTLRGGGFSCDGQALGTGVVITNQAGANQADAENWTLHETTVEVSGRTRWADLVEACRQRLRTPPVLTYYLGASVGGTLSAGGYGAASVAGGAQVDHVERLRLVLPEGEAVWCAPDENAELFRAALGGLGQIGYIERAVLRTAPYRPLVRVETREQPHWRALADDLLALADAAAVPDYYYAEYVGGALRSYAGTHLQAADLFSPANQTHVQTASCDFFCAPIQAVRPTADSCHVWCDYFLAAAALPAFLTFLEAGLRDGTLAAGLERLHFLCIRPPQTPGQRALAALPAHSSRRFYGVGVFYSMSTTEQATLHAARAAQRALLTECLRLDGRPYLCGAHNLDEAVLRAIFGAEYATLETLRARLDPGQLFNRRSRTEAQALATP